MRKAEGDTWWSGDTPEVSTTFTNSPFCTKSSTHSMCPADAALWRGEVPVWSLASTRAPLKNNYYRRTKKRIAENKRRTKERRLEVVQVPLRSSKVTPSACPPKAA